MSKACNTAAKDSPLSQALKVLGEPNRLRILLHLGQECRPVTDIINAMDLPQTNVSFHLRILREGGLVRTERRGSYIYYCLSDPKLLGILHDLKTWLDARQAPVKKRSASQSAPKAGRRSVRQFTEAS